MLAAVVGAGELRNRAPGLEGGGKFACFAVVPALAGAGRKTALVAGAGLARAEQRIEQSLPGHHWQRQGGAVGRAELGMQPALIDLEHIAAVALAPDHPLPHQRLWRLAILAVVPPIPLGHRTPPD